MKKTIAQIKAELMESTGEEREALIEACMQDDRKGIKNLLLSLEKQGEALRRERLRLEEMKRFEKKYAGKYAAICGIDEAGRGPLAGPVVAGACVLPLDAEILYLDDSKKLSEKKRENLYQEITKKAIAYGVGIISHERIDEINILQATFEAMRLAIEELEMMPDLLLVDALTIPQVAAEQVGIVKGDTKSVSIAAASILAKVTRDRIMYRFGQSYPEYGFDRNKGYGSAEHIAALKEHGPCPIHRKSFIKNIIDEIS